MINEVKIPEGLSKELTQEVEQWSEAIKKATKTHKRPCDAFEFLCFEDFFNGLPEELQKEVEEGDYSHELAKLASHLMYPKYLRQIRKQLNTILGIKNLNYHDSTVVSYDSDSELRLVRVFGGVLYQSYGCEPREDEIRLVSTNYVPCTKEELASVCAEMVVECIKSYEPYIPVERLNRLHENALLNSIEHPEYVQLVIDE